LKQVGVSLRNSGTAGAHPGRHPCGRNGPMVVYLLVAAGVVFVVRLAVMLTRRANR
jgi:hypothetical protein